MGEIIGFPEKGKHTSLDEHAAAIRQLGKRVIADVIEIGRRFTECKRICGHGNFLPWLDQEFGWSADTAKRFIQISALANEIPQVAELAIPISGLYMLAAPSTPPEARDEIIEHAKAGEPVSVAEVKRVVDAARSQAQPARRARNHARARLHREMKLGSDVMAKIKGTSLNRAAEIKELVILNRSAPPGELTKPVKQLVDLAAAGERVSAINYTKNGAAFRGEDVSLDNSGVENSQEKSNAATITITAVLAWLQTATAEQKRQVAIWLAQDTATIRKLLPAKVIPAKATSKQLYEKAMGLLAPDDAPVVH